MMMMVVVASMRAGRSDGRRRRRRRPRFRLLRLVRASAASVLRFLFKFKYFIKKVVKVFGNRKGNVTARGGVCVATDSFFTEDLESVVPVESAAAGVPFDEAFDSCPGDFTCVFCFSVCRETKWK